MSSQNRQRPDTERVETAVLRTVDAIMSLWPRPTPSHRQLGRARIVSHRGAFDNGTTWENTIAAFDRVVDAGVWGIEFDVRWTRDLQPVVFHDADFARLGGETVPVHHLTFRELRRRWPQVPTLAETVDRFGKSVHLMVELKGGHCPDPDGQRHILAQSFSGLQPVSDFHLMSLNPGLFDAIGCGPAEACLPIARARVAAFSRLAETRGYGGICGHYMVIRRKTLGHHHRLGQRIGTGFSNSRNCLFREIARGVDWVFSDRAAQMQRLIRRASRG